jgi:thymidylate kinase
MLVVLEGPDASGKTTILNHLKTIYPNAICTNVFDNEYGRLVKQLLNYVFIKKYQFKDTPFAKEFSRIHKLELMKNVISNTYTLMEENIVSNDTLVIMDRWVPSFYAYQKPYLNQEILDFFSQYFDYHEGLFTRPNFSFYLMPPQKVIIDRLHAKRDKDHLDDHFIEHITSIIKDYYYFFSYYDDADYYEVVDTSLDDAKSHIEHRLKSYLSENRKVTNV